MAAATIISAVATAASAAASAAGAIQAGDAQQQAANYTAQTQRINAGTALASSAADSQRLQEQSQRRVAAAANSFGGDGVDATVGSPVDVLADQATQGALDSEIARWRGVTAATSDLNQSAQSTYVGEQASAAGQLKAGSTLLTTGLNFATGQYSKNYSGGAGGTPS